MATAEPLGLVNPGDLVGVLVAHLQEALQARRRVLGALAVIAVRQEADEAGLPEPLGLSCRQELVKDDLGAVGKVSELGLPEDQRVRVLHRIPELVSKDTCGGGGAS